MDDFMLLFNQASNKNIFGKISKELGKEYYNVIINGKEFKNIPAQLPDSALKEINIRALSQGQSDTFSPYYKKGDTVLLLKTGETSGDLIIIGRFGGRQTRYIDFTV
jgi:hypothetical protein